MQPMMSFKRHAAELKRKKLQVNLQFLSRNQTRNPNQSPSQTQILSPSLIRHPNRNRTLCQILSQIRIQQRPKYPPPGEE